MGACSGAEQQFWSWSLGQTSAYGLAVSPFCLQAAPTVRWVGDTAHGSALVLSYTKGKPFPQVQLCPWWCCSFPSLSTTNFPLVSEGCCCPHSFSSFFFFFFFFSTSSLADSGAGGMNKKGERIVIFLSYIFVAISLGPEHLSRRFFLQYCCWIALGTTPLLSASPSVVHSGPAIIHHILPQSSYLMVILQEEKQWK